MSYFDSMDKVRNFNPDFTDAYHQAFKETITSQEIPNIKFYNRLKNNQGICKVPVKNIVGTNHERYAGRSWFEMFGNMKRYKESWTKNDFLEFSKSEAFQKNMNLDRYGEKYILNGGNHRICQAILSDLEFILVPVTEYLFDEAAFKIYTKLKNLGLLINGFNTTNSWNIQLNGKFIVLKGNETALTFIKLYEEINVSLKNRFLTILSKKVDDFHLIDKHEGLQETFGDIFEHKLRMMA